MIRQPPPLPGHRRSPSGHDIPIPESVFVHLEGLDAKINAVEAKLDNKLDTIEASLKSVASKQDAGRNQTMIDLAKILVPAVLAIVGGQRLLAPAAPEPTRVEVHTTPVTPAQASECMGIQPGTQAQAECFARIAAEIQSGKRPASTTP